MQKEQIINKIEDFINEHKLKYAECYCGITAYPNTRVYNEHNVAHSGINLICEANTEDNAREIEKYFLDKGCKGGDGGGKDNTKYVYLYKITSSTKQ